MVPTGGGEPCISAAKGRVTITHSPLLVETMHVEVTGLPANTDFDLFVIQVPAFPFGLSWYMGDMLTNSKGEAVGDFIGRFNIGTFIVRRRRRLPLPWFFRTTPPATRRPRRCNSTMLLLLLLDLLCAAAEVGRSCAFCCSSC